MGPEFLQGEAYAGLIAGAGHKFGDGFQFGDGVGHGDWMTDAFQEAEVVVVVAEGHGMGRIEADEMSQSADAVGLGGVGAGDI